MKLNKIIIWQFFKLYPVNAKNEPLSERQIFEQLTKIVSLASTKTAAVGILSSDNRDKWASSYAQLIKGKLSPAPQ